MKELLLTTLANIDDWTHDDVDILERGEAFRDMLSGIEETAVRGGHSEIAKTVQVRSKFVSVQQVRLIIARCLETLKPNQESVGELMNANEVATMLNISTRTVWRMRSAQELPEVVRVGGNSVRWRRDDIEKMIGKVG